MSGQPKAEKVYHGIAASAGICRGKVVVLRNARHAVVKRELPSSEIPAEINRFEQALITTRQQLTEIERHVARNLSASGADIINVQLMMLEDPMVAGKAMEQIRDEKVNADYAFHTAAGRYIAAMEALEDEMFRERAADLRDLTSRVLDNLLGAKDQADLGHLREPCVLVAHDLSPSVTAQMDKKRVIGFATDVGSKTSHTAILSRSLDIPALVGAQNISEELETGDTVLLDGYSGTLIVNPTEKTLEEFSRLQESKALFGEKLREIQRQPAVTLDGKLIHLSANIKDQKDIASVITHGAEGVGLFRTEFLYLNREHPPTEEEQYKVYSEVAAALKPHNVIIRTLDLGGDKFVSHLQLAQEMNPFLGWRAIRFCLAQPELFRAQLRAILRASAGGNIKMMYPMVSGLDEVVQANALVEKCKDELRAEKIPFDENLEIGVMIEIPSAAIIANALAKRVKFFSIGSNDLIQYTLAADRTNERVSHLYEPTHPAIIRLIKMTVEAAHANGIWAGVCGEIAGDPVLAPLLVGLGVDELSAAPGVLDEVKYIIRRINLDDAIMLADYALSCESSSEIFARSVEYARTIAPGLFETKA
jgi:phosphotransferase system enzyme I (PtsI)